MAPTFLRLTLCLVGWEERAPAHRRWQVDWTWGGGENHVFLSTGGEGHVSGVMNLGLDTFSIWAPLGPTRGHSTNPLGAAVWGPMGLHSLL